MSHLQSLDTRIIKSFKAHYKQNYCCHILTLFEESEDINKKKVNIKEAIDYLVDAWDNVISKTIFNCWIKTEILSSSTEDDIADVTRTQQNVLNHEIADINKIIDDLNIESENPFATLLTNILNDFFCNLEKDIPTEDILDENDIIKLIQEEMDSENDNLDDSEDEPVLVFLDDATKSLQTWITFFKQQETDEFKDNDERVFRKYFKTVQKLKSQTKKQVLITDFFTYKD